MRVPMEIGDYVDFYSSIEHATNLGRLFRPNAEALLPNWRWIPVGYHGRSSTIVIDGTPVRRPRGQRKPPDTPVPQFGPTGRLDIELEIGFVTGPGNELGDPIDVADAREHIFGLVLVNDWSARDIQAWEYQPLGPFLGKSFATTISPWIVTLDALEPFRVEGPHQHPEPFEYLRAGEPWAYAIRLAIEIQTARMREQGGAPETLSQTTFRDMYWNVAQQLAHATVNGAIARPGDLFASGTISGAEPRTQGSLIELTWNGERPIALSRRRETRIPRGRRRDYAARLVREARRAPHRFRRGAWPHRTGCNVVLNASRLFDPGAEILGSSHCRPACASCSGLNVSIITAISSVDFFPRLDSTAPGCGPCGAPAAWSVSEPSSTPRRLMKFPLT